MLNSNFRIAPYKDIYKDKVINLLNTLFDYGYSPDYLSSEITEKYVLFIDEEVAGFIEFSILLDTGEILMLGVDGRYQGRGFGSMLIGLAFEKMKDRGVKDVYLDVSVNNKKAIDFYKEKGFEEVMVRKRYYRSGDDAILMRKRL